MALILRNGGSQSPDRWLKEPRNNHAKMEIDYDYMKSYIKVIEKIVISDVVKYKDSLNTASDITSD